MIYHYRVEQRLQQVGLMLELDKSCISHVHRAAGTLCDAVRVSQPAIMRGCVYVYM